MEKFVYAQGDVMLIKSQKLPDGLAEVMPKNGKFIITHSETGHDHVITLDREVETPSVRMYSTDNPLVSWLEVNRPATLKHMRNFDTHEPIPIPPGVYKIHRQREYTPEGFRGVQD